MPKLDAETIQLLKDGVYDEGDAQLLIMNNASEETIKLLWAAQWTVIDLMRGRTPGNLAPQAASIMRRVNADLGYNFFNHFPDEDEAPIEKPARRVELNNLADQMADYAQRWGSAPKTTVLKWADRLKELSNG